MSNFKLGENDEKLKLILQGELWLTMYVDLGNMKFHFELYGAQKIRQRRCNLPFYMCVSYIACNFEINR